MLGINWTKEIVQPWTATTENWNTPGMKGSSWGPSPEPNAVEKILPRTSQTRPQMKLQGGPQENKGGIEKKERQPGKETRREQPIAELDGL